MCSKRQGPHLAAYTLLGMKPDTGRPLSRALVRMIRDISKNEVLTPAEGLRAIEERQAREIEFFLHACALRLESCI